MLESILDEPAVALSIHLAVMALLAVGSGIVALIPELQRFVVENHQWMTNEQFVTAFTLAQVAPGPNIMFVTLIGWQVAGWTGALATTLGCAGGCLC